MLTYTDKDIELWRDIPGYEGVYQASNLGRVKTLERMVNTKGGKFRTIKERIRVPSLNTSGYLFVRLSHKNKQKVFLIHKIIATLFNQNTHKKTIC